MMEKSGKSGGSMVNSNTKGSMMEKSENGMTKTGLTVLELWEAKKKSDKSAKVRVLEQEVGIDGYVDIKEAAKILDRSVYRVRQLYWDGRLGSEKRVGKKIFLRKAEVEKWKVVQNSRKVRNNGLEKRRFGTRVVKSTEVVMELLGGDESIGGGLKNSMMEVLRKYRSGGMKIEKEYSRK